MNLQKLREAYLENLKAYNSVHPIEIDGIRKGIMIETIEEEKEKFLYEYFDQRAKKILKDLKNSVKFSGNAQIWKRGDSLENLNLGMKERVEKALRFGI